MAVDKPAPKSIGATAPKTAEPKPDAARPTRATRTTSTTSTSDARQSARKVGATPKRATGGTTAARDGAGESVATRLRSLRSSVARTLAEPATATTLPTRSRRTTSTSTDEPRRATAEPASARTRDDAPASPERASSPAAEDGSAGGLKRRSKDGAAGGTSGGSAAGDSSSGDDGAVKGGGPIQKSPGGRAGQQRSAADQAALAEQQEQLGGAFTPGADRAARDQAARYFETHDTYIDPQSGIEYQAEYDPATGELELSRENVDVPPANVAGGTALDDQPEIDAPAVPLSTDPPDGRPGVGGTGGLGGIFGKGDKESGKGSVGAALTEIVAKMAVQGVVDSRTGERMSAGEAVENRVKKGVALIARDLSAGTNDATTGSRGIGSGAGIGSVQFSRFGTNDPVEDAPAPELHHAGDGHDHVDGPAPIEPSTPTQSSATTAEMDEVIVIQMDGDRQTTRTFAVSLDDGGEVRVVEEISSDHAGEVTGGSRTRTANRSDDTGSRELSTTERFGAGGAITARERRDVTRTPDGATTTQTGAARFEGDGVPVGAETNLEYRFGPVTAREHSTTSYENGEKRRTVIEQSAVDTSDSDFLWFGTEDGDERIEITYDDEGEIASVDGPTGETSPLNDIVGDHPTAAGERFAFSTVRSTPTEIGDVPIPGHVTGPGIIVEHRDVEIFQEHGVPGQGGANDEELDRIRSYIDASPENMREDLEHVDLLDGRNPQDAFWEVEYDIEGFRSGATGGGGRMTYYGGGNGESTFYHELGHISGSDAGAPDEEAWREAIESDAGKDDEFLAQGEVIDDGGIAHDSDGVTDYGNQSYTSSGSENEDWADSVELWLSSRRNGGLVTVRLPDGTERTATFEELYPARAAILEEYYGD